MKKWLFITIAAIAIVIGTVALLQTNEAQTLQAVEQKVATAYHATITASEQRDDTYTISFTNERGQYVIDTHVDGTFMALTQLSEQGTRPQAQPPTTPVQLPLEQILAIATEHFVGDVEQYEFIASATGGYYEVELERDEQEVEMQIHAVTGDILSIVYDD